MRFRFSGAVLCILSFAIALAPSAQAAGTGGVTAGEANSPSPAAKPKLHLFPVTAHTPSLAYHGPIYVKTASGEVQPYQPGSSGQTTTGSAASLTGGASPASQSSPSVPPLNPASLSGPAQRPELLVPGTTARYVDGLAAAPMGAPAAIQEIVWAGNELIGLPYIYGGGHGSWIDSGYDCSGTVSFALHGASLLHSPEDSSEFEGYGSHGIGRWVTIFANPGHAYMTVAGLRLDTSAADDPSNQQGPRWRPLRPANSGFTVRHPLGL